MARRIHLLKAAKRPIVGLSCGAFLFASCIASGNASQALRRVGVKCKVQDATDTEKSGLSAFRFLVPDGWRANTSFRWLPPSYTAFGCDLSASTPDLHSMVDCVEHTVMTYSSGFGSQPGKARAC